MELIAPPGLEIQVEADSIVFAVIGDYGKAGEAEADVANMVKSWNPDFIITTGDNNYEKGRLLTIKNNISDYYGDYIYNFDASVEYQCNGRAFTEDINRFFPSPGNHDANNDDGLLPYLNFFTLPQDEIYYSFVWGPVSFFSLNSVDDNMEDQKIWLSEQLHLSVSPFNIVYFHHPPYSSGLHGNSEKMQWDYSEKVDLVLSGHDHIYSRILNLEEDLYYIVNGLGGKSQYKCNANPLAPADYESYCYDAGYGAIKATSTYSRLVLEFYAVSTPDVPIDRLVIKR